MQHIDARLMDHGERTAFIARELMNAGGLTLNDKTLFLLSAFHDIGVYKTDEIDRMVDFETKNVENHAVYGYLFLKYMSPLAAMSETILYHHTPWSELNRIDTRCRDYASLICLADRIDIIYLNKWRDRLPAMLRGDGNPFRPDYIDIAIKTVDSKGIFERLENGEYKAVNTNELTMDELIIKTQETLIGAGLSNQTI